MKITEPKTPYVRYNAELDEVEGGACALSPPGVPTISAHVAEFSVEIPAFDLGMPSAPSPPPASPSPVEPSSPRRPSFSTGKRPGRSSSGSSNRSASFNLPPGFQQGEVQEETSDDEPMSPEGAYHQPRLQG